MDSEFYELKNDMFLFQKTWTWIKGASLSGPVFPIFSAGSVVSQKDKTKYLYYAIDRKYNLWLGVEKHGLVCLEHFALPIGMDVLYNFNILGWAQMSEGIPTEIYSLLIGKV